MAYTTIDGDQCSRNTRRIWTDNAGLESRFLPEVEIDRATLHTVLEGEQGHTCSPLHDVLLRDGFDGLRLKFLIF